MADGGGAGAPRAGRNGAERPLRLSQSEQRMVSAYRTLSKDQRELIAQNIRFMQEQNQK
ncbi:MAG: hypothetical protein J6A62_03445 [Oscillospiraceae bacterium]|nr:hypothetical protein [Oscillospiraceae bacterium]